MVSQPVVALVPQRGRQACATVVAIDQHKSHCAACAVRGLCLPAGLDSEAVRMFDHLGTRSRVRKRETLYRPGDPFVHLFALRVGTFKTSLVTEDGREQILGYHLAGEVLGVDGMVDRRHACRAVALEDSEVCGVPFDLLDDLAHDMPGLRRNLYRSLSKNVCDGLNVALLLGSRRAEERLAIFLLDLGDRYKARGYSASEFVLRMTRDEVASYLALNLETVSRLFSHLQAAGLIEVEGRAVKIIDRVALKALAGQVM